MKQLPAVLIAAGGGYLAWKFLRPKPVVTVAQSFQPFVPHGGSNGMIDGYGTTIEDPNPCPNGQYRPSIGAECIPLPPSGPIDWTKLIGPGQVILPTPLPSDETIWPDVRWSPPKVPPPSTDTMTRDGAIIIAVIAAAYFLSRSKK